MSSAFCLLVFLLGELSIHLDNSNLSDTATIAYLLDSFFFVEHIFVPFCSMGHTREQHLSPLKMSISTPNPSDSCLVLFQSANVVIGS